MPPAEHHQPGEIVRGVIRSYRRSLAADRRHLLERYRYVHMAREVVGVGTSARAPGSCCCAGATETIRCSSSSRRRKRPCSSRTSARAGSPIAASGVVEGQRLMQAASDMMLGWVRATVLDGTVRDFYVRQLWDQKGSALVEAMNPKAMTVYAELCGRTLAKAHARSGDSIAIASYLGAGDSFDRALASFAEHYADQNERDYHALKDAVESGRIAAETSL